MAVIGFIGLGNMGFPMACRLKDAGHEVRCFDVSTSVMERAHDAAKYGVSRVRVGEQPIERDELWSIAQCRHVTRMRVRFIAGVDEEVALKSREVCKEMSASNARCHR